jgi:hypothetical protein
MSAIKRVMVRYEVMPDRVAENEGYVRAVFAELERTRPEGLRYATYKLEDGVTFVHIASIETVDGSNPLLTLEPFRAFAADIRGRCRVPPIVTELETVGAYRLFS